MNKHVSGRAKRLLPVFLSIVCAVVLALSLVACSTGPSGTASGKTDTSNGPSGTNGTSTTNGDTSGNTSASTKIREGSKAPDFNYTTTTGTQGKLSDHRGQVVFINFWASWCGPCMQEMPDIDELRKAYPEVVILEVNVSDEKSDAMAFIEQAGYDVNWIIDDGTIAKLYPSSGIPYTLILDKTGTVDTIFEGSAPNMFGYFEKAVKQAGAGS